MNGRTVSGKLATRPKARLLPVKEELKLCEENILFGLTMDFHNRGKIQYFAGEAERLKGISRRAVDGEKGIIKEQLAALEKIQRGAWRPRDTREFIKSLRQGRDRPLASLRDASKAIA